MAASATAVSAESLMMFSKILPAHHPGRYFAYFCNKPLHQ
jgi:hypothetical protein